MADLSIKSKATLNNGVQIPLLGLGVWQIPGFKATQAVKSALEHGYRLIDTASIYGNEAQVGEAIRGSGIPREEICVVTKLWNGDHDVEKVFKAFEASYNKLQCGPIDLYLSHFPIAGHRNDVMKKIAEIQKAGYCKTIGVSNYTVRHLKELMDKTGIVPAINQVELHPWLDQTELLSFCKQNKILVQAYSPLAHGKKYTDPVVQEIATAHGKTPTQVLIRYGLELGAATIPKSANPDHIFENSLIFDFKLSSKDIASLKALNCGLRTCWDPTEEP